MKTMRLTISICLIAALGLLNAGCVDSRPIHYYTLETPPAPVNAGTPTGPVILVGNISVPPELEDGRIRYRIGTNEVGSYQFHRWAEPPRMMICAALVEALRASGKYMSVAGSSSSATGDYLLRGKLYEFDELDRESIQTSISLQVDLEDLKTRRVVWDDLVNRKEPVSTKNVADVVQSLDRNLQAVVKETAAAMDKFLAAHR
jgi:ABC-type uncharacterized transport system auxiliary subunit